MVKGARKPDSKPLSGLYRVEFVRVGGRSRFIEAAREADIRKLPLAEARSSAALVSFSLPLPGAEPSHGGIDAEPPIDPAWERYLDDLAERRALHAEVAAVKRLWVDLRARLGRHLALPLTQPSEPKAIQLSWDTGAEYVDIDVTERGLLWFYNNRVTGIVAGSDDEPIRELPADLIASLQAVA